MIGRITIVAVLLAAVMVCGHELWKISGQYAEEARIKDELSQYRPEPPKAQENKSVSKTSFVPPDYTADSPDSRFEQAIIQPAMPAETVNQSVIDLQAEVNSDIVGWLTIPNTQIDYPFVIAEDNDFYLRRNIYKKQAAAGSIFMDCRCAKDFTDFNTVLYGHNMKNNGMFGDLRLFADPGFFDSNRSGTLFVKDGTYTLEIFAYIVVRADDKMIYDLPADREGLLEYAKKNAHRYREPSATGHVVTLSTCAYEYDGARMVLLATIIPIE